VRYEPGPYGPRLVSDAGRPLLPDLPPASVRVTATWGAIPRPAREVVDLAARLLVIADQVARLGHGARGGAETFVITKLSVAAEMRSLAQEMDRP
jgi:hypothetical protein